MSSRSRLVGPTVLVTLLAGGIAGCAAPPRFMGRVENPRSILNRSDDAATVVFIRPSSMSGNVRCTIVDDHARFLGESTPSSYFAVKVPPGRHVFVGYAGNTAVVRATVDAGKVYFVEVRASSSWLRASVNLVPVVRDSDAWNKVDEWLAENRAYAADEAQGQAYIDHHALEADDHIVSAKERLADLARNNPSSLAKQTLASSDGR